MTIDKIILETNVPTDYLGNSDLPAYTVIESLVKMIAKINEVVDDKNLLDQATAIINDVITYQSNVEVVDARGIYETLKKRLDDVRHNTTKIKNNDLDISADCYKIKQINLAQEVIDAIAGTAGIIGNVADYSITKEKTAFFQIGKNKFNKDDVIPDYYVNNSLLVLSPNTSYTTSNYIKVNANTIYSINISSGMRLGYLDVNKDFISVDYPVVTPFSTPTNTEYIQFSCINEVIDSTQLEEGSLNTDYESYKYQLPKSCLDINDEILLFLPNEIIIAVDRTIELYYNQISWCGNIKNYHFKCECDVGKGMKRKWSYSPTIDDIGEYPFTCKVYDNNMNLLTFKTTTIKVVSNVVTPKNILCIGDSLTNEKVWLGELRTLSANQFTLVGTRGTAPLQHEGRSGWSAGTYLTGATYDYEGEGVNPFWDGAKFNWNYYKTNTGVNPDVIHIYLGTNGISLDPTINANNIKQIVDYIRLDDATIPIFLVFTLYRGNQDGIGNNAYKLEEDKKVYNLMVKLYELLSNYSNLHFIPVSLTHDSDNNFGIVETPVNPRAIQTELLPTEATHPQAQGYYQMADCIFSVLCKYVV